MTPERAISLPDSFWSSLCNAGISLLAVDEAHCISEWGPDFRLKYKMLHEVRNKLIRIPCVALTATATERVRQDIKDSLMLHDPFVFIGSFDRPNLYYSVKLLKSPPRSQDCIRELLRDVPRRVSARESTIIYCITVRDTEQVFDGLVDMGIQCVKYHGQLDIVERAEAHRSFVTDEVFVMVATIAFGTGIDKPDVRSVIHYGCPKSLEGYYQESGRCGRDGSPSTCTLYYSRSDFSRGDFYCDKISTAAQKKVIMEAFLASQNYCTIGNCRRQNLLSYFGQAVGDNCGNCDNCTSKMLKEKDLSAEVAMLLGCVNECGGRWGLNLPVDILRGSNNKKVVDNKFHFSEYHGQGTFHEPNWWKALGGILINNGYLIQSVNGHFRSVSVSKEGNDFIRTYHFFKQPLMLKLTEEMMEDEECSTGSEPDTSVSQDFLHKDEFKLYELLLEVRRKIAKDQHVPPYAICSDQVLRNIAKYRPSTSENMALVDGVNLNFVTQHSGIFIHCVRDMARDLDIPLDNTAEYGTDTDGDAMDYEDNNPNGLFDPICDEIIADACENPIPVDSIEMNVFKFISRHDGVTIYQIIEEFPSQYMSSVLEAVQNLVAWLKIYLKDDLYFKI